MNLDAMRVLLAVTEHGTVHGAAEAVGCSRATVRRRLQELEESLGVPLVDRGPRGVTVTEAGRLLADRSRLMVEDMSILVEEVRSTAAQSTRTLRVLMAEGVAQHYAARLIAEILQAMPELRLELRQSSEPLAHLMEATDVALVFDRESREGPWQKLPLVPTPERLVASAEYLAANPVESVTDLKDRQLLVWRSPEEPIDLLPLLPSGALPIKPHVVSADIHLLHHLALAGAGIAFVPDGGLQYENAPSDALVRVLPDAVGRDRWFSVIAAESLLDLPRIRELMTALQRFIASMRGATPAPLG
ncbi:MAG: hypothetical protein CVU56_14605 [Deltaproteobacteria bacterium HGW-Deltaproteobacteria-14]|jgi:DNA-binding transcriptional LysR family regulator|nr:MAG: hypothetical protein CVU56_14605 [Deltaproteobacteria bacterium HGW-Deltaproteobacteria-14]